MSAVEWFCERCRRWVHGPVCPSCGQVDATVARWMTANEIRRARNRTFSSQRFPQP